LKDKAFLNFLGKTHNLSYGWKWDCVLDKSLFRSTACHRHARRRQDDGQAYRLSFASETSRKEANERRQNSMKMGTSGGNAANFHRS